MEDIQNLILDTWDKLALKILLDRAELNRRLDRREAAMMTRPLRAWCLALRAADTRLGIEACPTPLDPTDVGRFRPHNLKITAVLLRDLCRPVTISKPGEPWDVVAQKLGVKPHSLHAARRNGTFRSHYIQGLGGRRGRPVPMLYTDRELDPCARGFLPADPAWGWTAEHLGQRVPDDFCQLVARVPQFGPIASKLLYDPHRHPEMDAPRWPPRPRLPSPEPDYVWYKWKNGVYVGDAASREVERRRMLARASSRRRRMANPPPRRAGGSLMFRGWSWLCPICQKITGMLYLPVPARLMLHGVDDVLAPVDVVHLPHSKAKGLLACGACHRVRFFSRASGDAWNDLVCTLTGGMLYGSEVPRPESFQMERRRRYSYKPMLNRSADKRAQVEQLLMQGCSTTEIAQKLKILRTSVNNHTSAIFKQHGVRGREGFARKMRIVLPEMAARTKRQEEVRDLLLKGLQASEIGTILRQSVPQINCVIRKIYREHGVNSREALAAKQNVKLPPRTGEAHAEIERRLSFGQKRKQISQEMKMNVKTVDYHLYQIRRARKAQSAQSKPAGGKRAKSPESAAGRAAKARMAS